MHYQTSLMICHPYLVKQQNDEFMNLVLRFFVAQGTLPELLELCWSACRTMRCRSASFDSWHSKSQTPRLGHSLIPSLTNGPYQDLASINQASLSLHGRVKLDDQVAGSKPRFDDRVVARFRSEVTKLCMKDGKPHEHRSQIRSTFVSALPGISSMGLVLRNPSSSCTLTLLQYLQALPRRHARPFWRCATCCCPLRPPPQPRQEARTTP